MSMGKVLAVVIGTIGGIFAGMLIAPKEGKKTREEIMNKINESKHNLSKSVQDAKDKATDKARESLETVKDKVEEMKDQKAEMQKKVMMDEMNPKDNMNTEGIKDVLKKKSQEINDLIQQI